MAHVASSQFLPRRCTAPWPYVVLRGHFAETLEAKTMHSDVSYVCFASNASFEADATENK